MIPFKKDEIIILLGAGASVDAGIPHSTQMVREIEGLITGEWSKFRDLYNYIKSAIHYADGIRGTFDQAVSFNVERVVNTLDQLRRNEEHPLYPFVGSWNSKLLEVAGPRFQDLATFRHKIVEQLGGKWIALEYTENADYYKRLISFQQEYQYPLRIFTLNYDLCVEVHCDEESLQRGFANRIWDWRLFEMDDKSIYLYKLHGSTDWVRDEGGRLTYKSSPGVIAHDCAEMIFGTSYKLQYVDPFLFFAYELRKWTLSEARLIITIGYGFGDEHINAILGQALNGNPHKLLLSVAPIDSTETADERALEIARILGARASGQVKCWNYGAKDFMLHHLNLANFAQLFPQEPQLFAEIGPQHGA